MCSWICILQRKDLDDFWHRKLTLKVKFWHKTFLILYPSLENSTTGIAITRKLQLTSHFFVHHFVVCSAHNSIRIRVFALVEFQVSFINQKPIRAWNLTRVLCMSYGTKIDGSKSEREFASVHWRPKTGHKSCKQLQL